MKSGPFRVVCLSCELSKVGWGNFVISTLLGCNFSSVLSNQSTVTVKMLGYGD